MAIQHVNRRGDVYYLHEGKTKTNKPRFFFSKKQAGTLAEAIPPGHEVYENPNAQVFLRKIQPRLFTQEELALVERGVRDLAKMDYFLIDVKDESIVVHLPHENPTVLQDTFFSHFGAAASARAAKDMQKFLSYSPMMRFTLCDAQARRFTVERWCFRGSVDGWIFLDGGSLPDLVTRYCPNLGKESFYELF